tara:strand:+ start:876 stop:1196 length:321 start_codon:yes stop_codon:yes gene_type:complete
LGKRSAEEGQYSPPTVTVTVTGGGGGSWACACRRNWSITSARSGGPGGALQPKRAQGKNLKIHMMVAELEGHQGLAQTREFAGGGDMDRWWECVWQKLVQIAGADV